MSAIPLTLFFSLVLTFLFIAFFAHEQNRRRFTSSEHDSLLPLEEEKSLPAKSKADHHDHTHHDDEGCGCRTGKSSPCPGCLKRPPSIHTLPLNPRTP